jgi:hypothetical protein
MIVTFKPKDLGHCRQRQSNMPGTADNQMVFGGKRLNKNLHLPAADRFTFASKIIIGDCRWFLFLYGFEAFGNGCFFIAPAADSPPKEVPSSKTIILAPILRGVPFKRCFYDRGKRIILPFLGGFKRFVKNFRRHHYFT